MSPFSETDGHDGPRLSDEAVPGGAAVIEDVLVGMEDAVGEPVVPHELPDVFDRVQFWRPRRQRQQRDVVGDAKVTGAVPTGLVEDDDGVGIGCDIAGDFFEVQRHRFGRAPGQDEGGAFSFPRTDGAEYVRRGGALILGCGRPGAAPRPSPGDAVLLADARLVLKPDLYPLIGADGRRDRCQRGGKVFLNVSSASGSWA